MPVTIEVTTTIKVTDSDLDGATVAPLIKVKKTVSQINDYQGPRRFRLANQTPQVMWDVVSDPETVTTFRLLQIWTDGTVDLELTTNEGDADQELATVRLTPDSMYALGDEASWDGHGADDAFTGTLDKIEKIRVREALGGTANVWMLIAE